MIFISLSVIAQNNKVSGEVKDIKGNPLAGASVLVKGQNKGASTDKSGIFSIANLANGKYNLVVSLSDIKIKTSRLQFHKRQILLFRLTKIQKIWKK